jgi:hypothetical protein
MIKQIKKNKKMVTVLMSDIYDTNNNTMTITTTKKNDDYDLKLLEAVKNNRKLSDVILLLDMKANADYQFFKNIDSWGGSESDCPLRHAVQNNNEELVRLLLENGAKMSTKFGSTHWTGSDNREPVSNLLFKKNSNIKILNLFLKYKFDPNQEVTNPITTMRSRGSTKKFPINYLINNINGSLCYLNNKNNNRVKEINETIEKLNLLLKFEANPNLFEEISCNNERNGIYYALTSPLSAILSKTTNTNTTNGINVDDLQTINFNNATRLNVMITLLKHGADPNQFSTRTSTLPLYIDCDNEKTRISQQARSQSSCRSVNIRVKETPLYLAILSGSSIEFIFILLLYGADPSLQSIQCEYDTQGKNEKKNIYELISSSNVKVSEEVKDFLLNKLYYVEALKKFNLNFVLDINNLLLIIQYI